MGGRLLADPDAEHAPLPPISTDTRTLERGQTFVALIGENFDGHSFVGEALNRGAALAVLSEPEAVRDSVAAGCMVIEVPETTGALQLLAHYMRRCWGGRVVGITGSMGKTTTKAFAAQLLARRFRVLESPGNLNNQVGVPLSLFELQPAHDVAVLELGMNQAGEIERLARVAAPETGVLTNVAPVHLEFFDDVDGIAAAKGELLGPLGRGTLVFNADDPWVSRLAGGFDGPRLSFGFAPDCDVFIDDFTVDGPAAMDARFRIGGRSIEARVPFAGRPFLYNVAAAAAVSLAEGLDIDEIADGIACLTPLSGRGQLLEVGGVSVWDDSYNANPRATEALLETVASLPDDRRKVIVLGAMLELGADGEQLHREVGEAAAALGPALLVTVGAAAEAIAQSARDAGMEADRVHHFAEAASAGEFVRDNVTAGDLLVVKGSRGVRTEAVVDALRGGES